MPMILSNRISLFTHIGYSTMTASWYNWLWIAYAGSISYTKISDLAHVYAMRRNVQLVTCPIRDKLSTQ